MPMYLSPKEFNAKARELGSAQAAIQWMKANGYAVDANDMAVFSPSDPNAPQQTGELPPLPGQTPVYPQPTGGLNMAAQTAAPQQTGAPPLSDEEELRQTLLGYPAKRALAREAQFKAAQDRIAQMYGGTSTSDMLFALSQALLSPRPYGGFGGTMYNVSQALGGISKADEEAKRKRAEAEYNLQQSYDKAAEDDEIEALKLRYQLVKEANDKIAAANKPQWARTEDPVTGEITLTPVYANSQQASSDIDPADLKTLFTNPTKLPLPRLIELFNGRYGAGRAEKLLGVK